MCKDTYIAEMQAHFGTDKRRINHALKVLRFAEMILEGENVADDLRTIVTITALLHDVGIKAAEEKYKSSAGRYQEIEGPPIAEEIMRRHGETEAVIGRVAYIIGGHHTAAKNNGLDFQIIWEADLLVNIEEDGLADGSDKLGGIIERNFRTNTGKAIAYKEYLPPRNNIKGTGEAN